MLAHRSPPPLEPADARPLAGLVRTHWMLAVCIVCGHERVHGERCRASCPTCGAALHSFTLYRDLHAGR
jgi:rubrerythrin